MAGKYKVQLKQADGTMADLPLVATYDSNGNKIADTYATAEKGIYYIKGTSTAAGTWTGTHTDIKAYYDGLTIAYHTNKAGGSSTTTLNINGLGAKTCYLRGTTKITTHYAVDTVVMFTYITVSGTGRWVTSDYDANNYAYVRQYFETANSELPIIMSHSTSTSGDDGYKTAYGGVVAGVTLNPSTKTISATAFKENGTSLADKYATKSSVENKADVYAGSGEKINLSQVQVGMDLSGLTLTFDGVFSDEGRYASIILGTETVNGNPKYKIAVYTPADWGMYNIFGLTYYSESYNGYVYYDAGAFGQNSSGGYGWMKSSYTFPVDTTGKYVITSIVGNLDILPFSATNYLEVLAVDCEYNYKNKANVYKTSSTKLRGIQVGDDLSGKTIYFDTTKGSSDMSNYPSVTISGTTSSGNSYLVSSSMSPPELYVDGKSVFYYSSGWTYTSLTLPSTVGTVTSISGSAEQIIKIEAEEELSVDCKYNYNEIQIVKNDVEILKETANNSSGGGGVYLHQIMINYTNGSGYLNLFLSTSDQIDTTAKLYAVIGSSALYTPVAISHMHGKGAGSIQCTSASSITLYGVVYSGSTVNVINETTVNAVRDTVKQV